MESLQNALLRVLRDRGLDGELKGWDAVDRWSGIVGPRIAGHSRAIAFRQGALEVEVDGSAWMQELTILKRMLIQNLNRELGATTVRELRYVVPRGGNRR